MTKFYERNKGIQMANRKLRVLLKKKYANGSIDTIYFRTRPADVIDDQGNVLTTYLSKLDGIAAGATKVTSNSTNGKININGTATSVYTHPTSGVTAGSYNYVTVDANGHVTSASNKSYLTTTGNASNCTTAFTTASSRTNIATGEKLSVSMGKIAKYFTDLGSMAFTSKVGTSNLDSTLSTFYGKALTTDNVTDSTSITANGWVADAKVIKTLQDQINTINGNLDTVFGAFNLIRRVYCRSNTITVSSDNEGTVSYKFSSNYEHVVGVVGYGLSSSAFRVTSINSDPSTNIISASVYNASVNAVSIFVDFYALIRKNDITRV